MKEEAGRDVDSKGRYEENVEEMGATERGKRHDVCIETA